MSTSNKNPIYQYITRSIWSLMLIAAFLLSNNAAAQSKNEADDLQWSNAAHAAERAGTKGPAKITLLNQATVELAKGTIFIPRLKQEP